MAQEQIDARFLNRFVPDGRGKMCCSLGANGETVKGRERPSTCLPGPGPQERLGIGVQGLGFRFGNEGPIS